MSLVSDAYEVPTSLFVANNHMCPCLLMQLSSGWHDQEPSARLGRGWHTNNTINTRDISKNMLTDHGGMQYRFFHLDFV